MRVLGLDLGTKTLGIAISDKTNVLACPLEVIKYENENYKYLIEKLKIIVKKYNITDIVLGLPKNMDNTIGVAALRSQEFQKYLTSLDCQIHLQDERLSTKEAYKILIGNQHKKINQSKKIDMYAACIILESFLKEKKYEK